MYKNTLTFRYPKLLTIFNVLIGVVLTLSVLMMVRDLLTFAYMSKSESRSVSIKHEVTGNTIKDISEYEGILKNNPFGFPGGQLRPLGVKAGGPISQLDAKLIGTVSGPQIFSYAVFVDKNGRQDVFKLGENVFGAGKLRKIEKERVFIAGTSGISEIQIADIVAIKDVTPPSGATGANDFARSAGSGTYIVDQKKILHALENPNQLMTDVRLQPNIVNGQQEGFILREVRSGGIYQSLGLQNGDVLLRINDYGITNPENALQAFTALRGMDRVQLDIVRGGSKVTMTYLIR